jgi:hypothetical protein
MAHYVYLDKNNIVTNVIVGPDEGTEPDGVDSWEEYFSAQGQGVSLRTSYNTSGGVHYDPVTRKPSSDQSKAFRKNYAGIGFTYDEERDAFIPPQPYKSWVLNESTCLWDSPIPYPTDGNRYEWSEKSGSWVGVQ